MDTVTPDNTDPRGVDIIRPLNSARDSVDSSIYDVFKFDQPSFNSNPQHFYSGGLDTTTPRDEINRVVIDILRNTSINGVFPTVAGNTIDFSLPSNSASDQWYQQNWPLIDSNSQIINSKIAPFDNNVQLANSKIAPVDSNYEIVNSRAAPSDSNNEVASSKVSYLGSNVEIATSRSVPSIESNSQINNAKI